MKVWEEFAHNGKVQDIPSVRYMPTANVNIILLGRDDIARVQVFGNWKDMQSVQGKPLDSTKHKS